MTTFTCFSTVHWDELDAMQMLHNSRYAAHVERAIIAWYSKAGGTWTRENSANPDQFHVVREFRIEYLTPVLGPGTMRIEVSIERVGTTSCSYAFVCSSEDGSVQYARGERTIVKIDPESRRPASWSDAFRERHAAV